MSYLPGQIWAHLHLFATDGVFGLHQAFVATPTASISARNRELKGLGKAVPGKIVNRCYLIDGPDIDLKLRAVQTYAITRNRSFFFCSCAPDIA